jgi:hypothetical protein
MTPLLGGPFLFVVGCLYTIPQVKPPVTSLEGGWREPLRPGEKASDRLAVTFTGEEIKVIWYDGAYRGTLKAGLGEEYNSFAFTLTRINEKNGDQPSTHICRCLKQGDQLFLVVLPNRARGSGNLLELAPVTFRLEKVKK